MAWRSSRSTPAAADARHTQGAVDRFLDANKRRGRPQLLGKTTTVAVCRMPCARARLGVAYAFGKIQPRIVIRPTTAHTTKTAAITQEIT